MSHTHIVMQLGKPSELIFLQLTQSVRNDQCYFPLKVQEFSIKTLMNYQVSFHAET